MKKFNMLFSPAKIGKLELKNRMIMSAVEHMLGDAGKVTEAVKAFYSERAKGGVALISSSALEVLHTDPGWRPPHLGIYDDRFIPGLSELTKIVHAADTKFIAQLLVDGLPETEGQPLRVCTFGEFPVWEIKDRRVELVGPSDVVVSRRSAPVKARPLTVAELQLLANAAGEAALRAREAGCDGVEFHLGAGLLLNQFLSPLTNKRTDQYGGSPENRMRFVLEIIESVRRKAGKDYPIMCRLSPDEFVEGGNKLSDSQKTAILLEKGGVDAINTTGGWFIAPVPSIQMSVPRGALAYLAEGIKKVVTIPVIASNRINDPYLAEQIIAEGKADLVAMARTLIADPEFPQKTKEDKCEDIRPCIACCVCVDSIFGGRSAVRCTVNPRAGGETKSGLVPTKKEKRVVVVGGGPAGMEAAVIAAQRGHHVILCERSSKLGGQLLLAAIPPYKDEIAVFIDYLVKQVKKSKVEVRLDCEANPEFIERIMPDVVIVAAGVEPIIPDIPGVRLANVVTAKDALNSCVAVGQNVIVMGGGMVGCETAEFLTSRGKRVTILEMLGGVGLDINPSQRWVVVKRMAEAGVSIETKTKVVEITDSGCRAIRNESSKFYAADTVVLAVGSQPKRDLFEKLQGRISELFFIGDCSKAGKLMEAMSDGYQVAQKI